MVLFVKGECVVLDFGLWKEWCEGCDMQTCENEWACEWACDGVIQFQDTQQGTRATLNVSAIVESIAGKELASVKESHRGCTRTSQNLPMKL